MSEEEDVSIPTLQLRVVEMRKGLRPLIKKKLVELETQKVHNLAATKFVGGFDAVEIPVIKDPFHKLPVQTADEAELLEEMKNLTLLLTILNRKKSCPTSQVIDHL